jgi:uncharacterized small protein (DUF1192 family)
MQSSQTKPRRLPVSRTIFSLSDRDAFNNAIDLALSWIAETGNISLPVEAVERQSFEIISPIGESGGSVVRMDDAQGAVWAARFDNSINDRIWSTDLFVEQRIGGFTRFGAQLACQAPPNDPGFEHSRPRLVRSVLEKLAAEADDEPLPEHFVEVLPQDVDELVGLLYRPSRRLPVIVVSTDDEGGAQIDLKRLANRISGTAHLRHLATDASYELTRLATKKMSTFNGAVRIYMPGLDQRSQDPFEHPLWLAPYSGVNPKLVGQLVDRVLPLGFRDADGDARFWRVGLLRQATLQNIAAQNLGSKEEQLEAEINALKGEVENIKETVSTAEALMDEANEKLTLLQTEFARLTEENQNLKSQLSASFNTKSQRITGITPDEIRILIDSELTLSFSLNIISKTFQDRVIILDSAFKSAEGSSSFRKQQKAFDLLWTLCTSYYETVSNGKGDVEARKLFGLNNYSAKESEKLSNSGRSRRIFLYRNNEIFMEKHLKIGVADNSTDTLRIHFEWIADERKIVIGYCGPHIDF